MQCAQQQGRLVGILNGCDYPDETANTQSLEGFCAAAESAVMQSIGKYSQLRSVDYIALRRLETWAQHSGPLLTSIGRLTDQKVLLLRQDYQGKCLLAELLNRLAAKNARLIILGTGNAAIEKEFLELAGSYSNFLFLNLYGERLSEQLYQLGDLFLMPSSFEPCGISQMLAMRAGQPCIAHAVGGLANTIVNNKNGFTFSGDDLVEQGSQLLQCVDGALQLLNDKPKVWQKIALGAKKSRFDWSASVELYVKKLYQQSI
ncbi:glycosyltransferase [Oceanicoccus sp. KOV_DT_Chl]|uniref:glycosyltransferase n=1 Tax=Oceanicoccus sp. KOV_DT_Chl TaxID=1904639 RepID=UPI00190E9E16|nr:glycosyltransferase [Oceanicoccus sp. KOV_DT_Chl]